MINKRNEEKSKKDDKKPDEVTQVSVSAHIQIKDKDTGKVLVDKRG